MLLASGTTIRHAPRTPAVTPVQVTKGDKGDTGAPGGSDASFAAFVGDPASATRAQLSATYARGISVKQFGAKGDGSTNDTAAFQAALNTLAAVTADPSSARLQRRPTLFIPAGVYVLTAPLARIDFRALRVLGEGSMSSAILYTGTADAPIFDIGTFSATPADVFAGVQDVEFIGLRLQINGSLPGTRIAQGIRSSGGGSVRLNDVAVTGFKYGINSPYGGDFNTYRDVSAEFCDVGVYQGPGGQQFETDNLNLYNCLEGLVLDRPGHVHMTKPIFNSCTTAGLVIEALSDTTTRQLTGITMTGLSYQSQMVFETPWFESNAGSLGDSWVSTNFIEVRGGGSDAYRDITVREPYIVAGTSAGKTPTAFFGNVSGTPAQRVRVVRPVFQGGMVRWFTNAGVSTVIEDPRTRTGYTPPAVADAGPWSMPVPGKRTVNSMPWTETFEQGNGAHGIGVKYDLSGFLAFGYLSAGTYFYRMGMDLQNRRMFFDDPSTPISSMSLGRASAQPTSGTYAAGSFVHNTAPAVAAGKVLLGWLRLTSGSGHVAGTDWTPIYGTTS